MSTLTLLIINRKEHIESRRLKKSLERSLMVYEHILSGFPKKLYQYCRFVSLLRGLGDLVRRIFEIKRQLRGLNHGAGTKMQ